MLYKILLLFSLKRHLIWRTLLMQRKNIQILLFLSLSCVTDRFFILSNTSRYWNSSILSWKAMFLYDPTLFRFYTVPLALFCLCKFVILFVLLSVPVLQLLSLCLLKNHLNYSGHLQIQYFYTLLIYIYLSAFIL